MAPRLATLAIALASAVTAAANALAQSDPTTVDAQKIEVVRDLEVSARCAAEIRRGELGVFGELLPYNREFGELVGEGVVRPQGSIVLFLRSKLLIYPTDVTAVLVGPGV